MSHPYHIRRLDSWFAKRVDKHYTQELECLLKEEAESVFEEYSDEKDAFMFIVSHEGAVSTEKSYFSEMCHQQLKALEYVRAILPSLNGDKKLCDYKKYIQQADALKSFVEAIHEICKGLPEEICDKWIGGEFCRAFNGKISFGDAVKAIDELAMFTQKKGINDENRDKVNRDCKMGRMIWSVRKVFYDRIGESIIIDYLMTR